MVMVRFKSKTVADNFRMAFVCARELLAFGQRSAASEKNSLQTDKAGVE